MTAKEEVCLIRHFSTAWVEESVKLRMDEKALQKKRKFGEIDLNLDSDRHPEERLYEWERIESIEDVEIDNSNKKKATDHGGKGNKDKRWLLSVNVAFGRKPVAAGLGFKHVLEVKRSRIGSELGLFAMIRFERGDIITVNTWDEENSRRRKLELKELKDPKLFLGGGFALDGHAYEGRRTNSRMTSNGVIRATQRIMANQEILVDFNRECLHPVDYLDCLVLDSEHVFSVPIESLGKIISYESSASGEPVYVGKYSEGRVEKMGQVMLEKRLVYSCYMK